MKKSPSVKDAIFFLFSLGITLAILIGITSDFLKTRAATQPQAMSEAEKLRLDPARDFKSFDNYLNYQMPPNWQKTEVVDDENGLKTSLTFKSPESSQESETITSGVSINLSRIYDASPEAALKQKLDGQYNFNVYNVRPLIIGGKNAMTMHEDKNGHNRFVFIASDSHLWKIIINSKDLDQEQQYENEINSFLNSITFKN